jgi:hypothetical protein
MVALALGANCSFLFPCELPEPVLSQAKFLRSPALIPSPWCIHTFSRPFNQTLIQVLLQKDFADLIKEPTQLTLR